MMTSALRHGSCHAARVYAGSLILWHWPLTINEVIRDRQPTCFKQIIFRLFKTLLPGLWLRLASSVMSPLFSNLYIGLIKINERIEYKLLSLTYKTLVTAQPSYLHSLISVQHPRATRSSSVVTLSRPPTSSLRITNRSFRYASPHLWNQLPVSFRQH